MKTVNRDRSSVIVLLVFAFLLRAGFLFLAGVNAPLTGDESAYQQIAENVAAGRGFFQTNNPFFPGQTLYAWQAPLYPLALAALYQFAGVNLFVAKVFGIVVSTATVFVVYDFARRVFRTPLLDELADEMLAHRIAMTAAFLVAIYPGFLTLAHLLLSEGLFIFLVMLAFDLVARALEEEKGRGWAWLWMAAGGAAWGLATLTRGLTLYFLPLFVLWLVWVVWRTDGSLAAFGSALVTGLVFAVVAVAVIAPWSARNYFQFQQVVLLETKGGVNLWLGNSPYTPNEFVRNVWKVGVREPMLNVLPQDELQRDRAAYGLALDYLRAEPLAAVARVPAKFADFWGFERSMVDVAESTREGGGWNSLPKLAADILAIVVYVFVMVCGIFGFIHAPERWRARDGLAWKVLLGGFVLYFLALHLLIFGDGRFHLPLIPLFAMYGAWFWVLRDRDMFRQARVLLADVLILGLLLVWSREIWIAYRMLQGG